MRKVLMVLGVAAVIALPTAGLAATLDTSKFTTYINEGAECKEEDEGAWYHFVLNQVQGEYLDGIVLWTKFDGTWSDHEYFAQNQKMQHFWVFNSGHLDAATTDDPDGGGPLQAGADAGSRAKLVISSYACGKFIDGPPTDED